MNVENFRGSLSMSRKSKKMKKKKKFLQKFTIFLPESELYMFLAFFWGIYLSCSSKFEILTLFCLKIFIFDFRHLAASSGKNMLHRGLFGVSMESLRLKYLFESKFWVLTGLLAT